VSIGPQWDVVAVCVSSTSEISDLGHNGEKMNEDGIVAVSQSALASSVHRQVV
jgi:hypothetical protein